MAGLTPGSKISHFEVLQKLGEGGMGVVYKARDLRLDRLVALKVLSENAASDTIRQARLVQEAKSASSLNHPHIVTVHEIDTVDGLTFIAMEYIEGRTLDQVIPQRGLRYTEVLKYAVQIAEGLAAAHTIGIIHRDVKPANVMVSGAGIVKVLDFGLAKHAGFPALSPTGETLTIAESLDLTRDGAIVGTVAYMSPEQAEGKPLDARSDIFSFGIVLYEMLTGRRPFSGDTRASTMAALTNQEPKPVRQVVEGLPVEIDRIVSRCLRKDPARRYQHMADLAVALRELKEESDSGSLAPAVPAKPTRKLAWLVGAAVVLGAAGGVWWATQISASPPQTVTTVTNYAGSELQPAFSPDGKQVAFSWDGEKGGNFDIYVKLIGETGALRLTSDPAIDEQPAWSPDGKRIAFRRRSTSFSALLSVSALGGDEQRLARVATFGQISWSPDGKWLATAGSDREPEAEGRSEVGSAFRGGSSAAGLVLLPVEGGEPRRILWPTPPATDSQPTFSRNGRELAFARCEKVAACDVYVLEMNEDATPRGAPRRVTNRGLPVGEIEWHPTGDSVVYSVGGVSSFLWKVDANGRQPPRRIEVAGTGATYPSIDASGNRLLYSRDSLDVDLWKFREGAEAEAFIVTTSGEGQPQFSHDGKKIAFQSERSGTPEVWLANADGSEPRQLTAKLGKFQGSPRWSPDAQFIAFDSQGMDGSWDIYVINVDYRQARRLTIDPSDEYLPSWSRDGKWVYFCSTRTGRYEVWRTPSAGGNPTQVTRNGGYVAFESVDGQTLYYSKAGESPLMAIPVSGGSEIQVLPSTTRGFQPVTKGIYYVGRAAGEGSPVLQFYDFATMRSRVLIPPQKPMASQALAVGSDEKTIVYAGRSLNARFRPDDDRELSGLNAERSRPASY